MDPLTLFALANGAVAAVKQGCKLYKDIKGAAADVHGVLKDLEEQFTQRHKNQPPSTAEKNQYIQEKNRVIELSKKQPDDIYTVIGEQLGTYFENYAICAAIFEEEEKHALEIYTGTASIGKRALQRVLMMSRLQAMSVELREIMVYQCPPELGDLYTQTENMMKKIQAEQTIAIRIKRENDRIAAIRRIARIQRIKNRSLRWGLSIFAVLYVVTLMWSVIEIRKTERPELGTCWIPKGTWPYKYYSRLKWVDCEN